MNPGQATHLLARPASPLAAVLPRRPLLLLLLFLLLLLLLLLVMVMLGAAGAARAHPGGAVRCHLLGAQRAQRGLPPFGILQLLGSQL